MEELLGGVEEFLKDVRLEVQKTLNGGYFEKFNSEPVRKARNGWHKAVCKLDYLRRCGIKEDSREYLRASEREAKAHQEYLDAKEEAGILEPMFKND